MSDVKTTPTETDAPAAKAAPAAPKPVKTTVKNKPVVKSKATGKKKVGKSAEPKLKTAKPQQAAKPAKASAPTETRFAMNQTIESMTAASNEALKEGFEKTLKSVTEASNFQKETVDALIASATVAGKGIETANANAVAYAKSLMEEGVTATKAIASAKSVQELFEIQTEFTKSAVDSYLAELNKTTDLFSGLMKDSLKPLNARVAAAMELAQASH